MTPPRETIDSNDPAFFEDGDTNDDYGWFAWLKAWLAAWWKLLTMK